MGLPGTLPAAMPRDVREELAENVRELAQRLRRTAAREAPFDWVRGAARLQPARARRGRWRSSRQSSTRLSGSPRSRSRCARSSLSSRCRRAGRSTTFPRSQRASISSSTGTPAPARRPSPGCWRRCTGRWGCSGAGISSRSTAAGSSASTWHDGAQDRAGGPAGARRRPLHRRGLRARARGDVPRFRAGGDRDAAQADGGLPPPPDRHRRRLSTADGPLPRLEPGASVSLLARDLVPRLLDGRAAGDHAQVRRRPRVRAHARAPSRRCARCSTRRCAGEGFGNARYARTIFEQALNAQALRLAGLSGRRLEELGPEELTTLTDEDVVSAATALGRGSSCRPSALAGFGAARPRPAGAGDRERGVLDRRAAALPTGFRARRRRARASPSTRRTRLPARLALDGRRPAVRDAAWPVGHQGAAGARRNIARSASPPRLSRGRSGPGFSCCCCSSWGRSAPSWYFANRDETVDAADVPNVVGAQQGEAERELEERDSSPR